MVTRSPSLDLVWPESPSQPSTTAGKLGELSPSSSQFVAKSATDARASRHLAVQQALHLYASRSSRAIAVTRDSVVNSQWLAKRYVLCYTHMGVLS